MANQLSAIKHIVQLMLENRSFDQMLGFLYTASGNKSVTGQPFEGLTGNESNPDDTGREFKVFDINSTTNKHPYLMPGAVPTNRGFVINFKSAIASDQAKHYKDTLPGTDPSEIMGMYSPKMLSIMSTLAREYAVCDHWFAS